VRSALLVLFVTGCTYNYGALGEHTVRDPVGMGGNAGGMAVAGAAGDSGSGGTGSGGGGSGGGGSGGAISGIAGSGGIGSGGAGAAAGSGGSGAAGSGGAASGGAGSGGVGSGGTGGGAGGAVSSVDPDLVLWYRFDEASGQTAVDSSGFAGGPRNATLSAAGTGGAIASSSTIHKVGTGAVGLTANGSTGGGYVVVPSLYDLVPEAVTITCWVYTTSSAQSQRVFDFGDNTTTFMFLTTTDTSGFVRLAITTSGLILEQRIQTATSLSLNSWHHVALVLAAGTPHVGYIYVDGMLAASNLALTLGVHDLGVTTSNYLGRSQFATDAYLNGALDDFRVYKRALTQLEISTIYALR
jgi:Concanavalin A-like lectin/glucanases superfamily